MDYQIEENTNGVNQMSMTLIEVVSMTTDIDTVVIDQEIVDMMMSVLGVVVFVVVGIREINEGNEVFAYPDELKTKLKMQYVLFDLSFYHTSTN